ncbi:uncharacterized protein LOC142570765 [Dermacentor variabilis]|uniref:uncharacterized protein LOC142570765 n=1 Tax=Dermacentor variabilis TaxID=34621 RepID=UPI003F5B296C
MAKKREARPQLQENHHTSLNTRLFQGSCQTRVWVCGGKSAKGCNRFVMVRDLWKIVHVPALTFANAVLCLSAPTREWLERRQREVGRIALGCHGAVANEAIQGDLGWSSFEAREAVSKIAYRGRLLDMPRERWARRVFDYLSATSKSTLAVYRCHNSYFMVHLYDNSLGSRLLFEARAGALRTLVRLRSINSDVRCWACGKADESIEHVVLRSEGIGPSAAQALSLEAALGFDQTGRGDGAYGVDRAVVAETKRRLECWRAALADGPQ